MVEPEKPLKRKDQILVDKEIAQIFQEELQAKLEKEERLWVDSFVPMDTKIDENVEAKVDDEAEMKKHMEIVPDDEVAIDAIPLATKSPIIID
ncbi:hypothetical protein Tco_0293999 [Tanacetum coccineum]